MDSGHTKVRERVQEGDVPQSVTLAFFTPTYVEVYF